MLTRRQVLAGTAASSIAAIASARGVAAVGADAGFGAGFGDLQNGAAVVFHKEDIGFSFFIKFRTNAAQIFYKEQTAGQIGLFLKFFDKVDIAEAAFHKVQWQLVDSFSGFLKDVSDASAGFFKLDSSLAQIFLKYENVDQQISQDIRTFTGGLLVSSENGCESPID